MIGQACLIIAVAGSVAGTPLPQLAPPRLGVAQKGVPPPAPLELPAPKQEEPPPAPPPQEAPQQAPQEAPQAPAEEAPAPSEAPPAQEAPAPSEAPPAHDVPPPPTGASPPPAPRQPAEPSSAPPDASAPKPERPIFQELQGGPTPPLLEERPGGSGPSSSGDLDLSVLTQLTDQLWPRARVPDDWTLVRAVRRELTRWADTLGTTRSTCTPLNRAGCYQTGWERYRGAEVLSQWSESVQAFWEGCKGGDDASCVAARAIVATMLSESVVGGDRVVAQEGKRLAALMCQEGSPAACEAAVLVEAPALPGIEKSCRQGYAGACALWVQSNRGTDAGRAELIAGFVLVGVGGVSALALGYYGVMNFFFWRDSINRKPGSYSRAEEESYLYPMLGFGLGALAAGVLTGVGGHLLEKAYSMRRGMKLEGELFMQQRGHRNFSLSAGPVLLEGGGGLVLRGGF